VVAERQRHLTVYEDQVGSTPIHFAKSLTMWASWLKPPDSQSGDRGFKSSPTCRGVAKLSRRQLVQGLLIAAGSPAAAQAQSVPYPATGIDHVQITVADLNRTQQFYEKLFGAKVANRRATQMELHVGGSDYISPHTEAGRIKPIDHFGLAVPNFSPEDGRCNRPARGPRHESGENRRRRLHLRSGRRPRATGRAVNVLLDNLKAVPWTSTGMDGDVTGVMSSNAVWPTNEMIHRFTTV
jgi:catechol 2,3-dioxygenase-like lactoylglutathione lyase family enzyme